jgi:signal transduction histidine kinase
MKLPLPLHTRFTVWISLLLLVLVGAIVWVTERREVSTIYAETRNKGVLIAKNLIDHNLRYLLIYDPVGIQTGIREQLDDKLLYVVFYDKYSTTIAYNREIADQPSIYAASRLQGDTNPDAVSAEAKDVTLDGRRRPVLEIEIPIVIRGSGDRWGSVKVGLSLADMRAEVRRTQTVLVLMGLGGFLLGLAGATILARRVTRPIENLVEGTVRVSQGDFSHRIAIDSADEIGNLARRFNDMSDRLLDARERMEDAHRQLVQAEKLASIGRLAATIAHEIRNPLTSVKLNVQKIVEDGRFGAPESEHLAISQEGIAQIEKFIKELLNYTRVADLHKARFPVDLILDESAKVLAVAFQEKRVAFERRVAPGLPEVIVDGDKMRQVVLNVLRNALEASSPGGRVTMTAEAGRGDAAGALLIRIEDEGPGIPARDWENVFEPFYTTKSTGIGLGLALSRKIAEQHHGAIRVVPKDGPGTAFEIIIPAEESA